MSAAFADFDHDGRLDVFVTNDTVPNFLFRNNGDGTFAEDALMSRRVGDRLRAPDLQHGHRRPGLRQRRLARHSLDGARRRDVPALPQRRARRVRRGDAGERPRPTDGQAVGLVLDRRRLRQRRLEGHLHRQLARQRAHRRFSGDRRSSSPTALFVNDGRGHFSDASDAAGLAAPSRLPTAAAESPTSTAMAVSTSSSSRWERQPSCGRTRRRRSNSWLIVRLVGTKSNRDGIGAVVQRRQSSSDDDDGDGVCVVVTRGTAFWSGRIGCVGPSRGGMALRNQAGGRGCQG